MKTIATPTIIALVLAFQAGAAERSLVPVKAPDHDPLYVDKLSIARHGSSVSFIYVLDVLALAEGRSTAGGWKSNAVNATIDCARRTFSTTGITAYAGPRATGGVVKGIVGAPPVVTVEKIVPDSTFAYLADFVCAKS